MTDVPPETPVTTPVPETTVATAVLPLLHVPPPASVSETVNPGHVIMVPVMAPGAGFTVTVVTVKHPVDNVYVITDVPAETPKTMPLPVPTVATPVLLLAQVPPPASVSAAVAPVQTFAVPVIAPGNG